MKLKAMIVGPLLFLALQSWGTKWGPPIPLPELVSRADSISVGNITKVELFFTDEGRRAIRFTMKIDNTLKGPSKKPFKQLVVSFDAKLFRKGGPFEAEAFHGKRMFFFVKGEQLDPVTSPSFVVFKELNEGRAIERILKSDTPSN